MIVVDTNIVSEMMRLSPDPNVATWIGRLKRKDLAVSGVAIFELQFGMALLGTSAERRRLEDLLGRFEAGWLGTVLPSDREAATCAANFRALRRGAGRPVSVPGSLIAGIALGKKARLATRNIRDFADAGLDLIDPFAGTGP